MKFKAYAFHKLSHKLRYQRMFAWSCPAKVRSVLVSKLEKLPPASRGIKSEIGFPKFVTSCEFLSSWSWVWR
jgi:hypothetical protein